MDDQSKVVSGSGMVVGGSTIIANAGGAVGATAGIGPNIANLALQMGLITGSNVGSVTATTAAGATLIGLTLITGGFALIGLGLAGLGGLLEDS